VRVLITAGGSGGHVYPALAVVEALWELADSVDVFWLGRPGKLEERLVASRPGIAFLPFPSHGVPRGNPLVALRNLSLVPAEVRRAKGLLRELQPDLVLGMGGYTSFAPGMAAHSLGIPLVIHEQNASLGLANRLLSRFAQRVLLSFPETLREVPDPARALVVGTPVRREILAAARPYRGDEPYLTVLGGSLGSRVLMDAIRVAARRLARLDPVLCIATGRAAEPSALKAELRRAGIKRVRVARFFARIGEVLSLSRLVVSRAGASTLAELSALGRPSILVPWGRAAGGHQVINAARMAARDAALVLREGRDLGARLGETVASLWEDVGKLKRMATAAAEAGRPDAAWAVARELLVVLEGGRCCPEPVFT